MGRILIQVKLMPIVLVPKCLEPKLYPLVYCDTNMKYISFVGMVRTKCEHKMHDLIGDSIRKPANSLFQALK